MKHLCLRGAFLLSCSLALAASCSQGHTRAAPSGKHEDLLGRLGGVHTLVTTEPMAAPIQIDVNFASDSAKLLLSGLQPREFRLEWLRSEVWPKAKLVQAGQDLTASVCGYMTLSPVRDATLRERNIYLELRWVRAPGLDNAVARTLTSACNWMLQVSGQYHMTQLSPCRASPGALQAIWQRCQSFAASSPSKQEAHRSAALRCLGASASQSTGATSQKLSGSEHIRGQDPRSVRELWKAALLLVHPDRNPKDSQCAEAATKLVNDARTWLDSLTL